MSDFTKVFAEIVAASEAYAPKTYVVKQFHKVREEFTELEDVFNDRVGDMDSIAKIHEEAADLIIAASRLIHCTDGANPGEVVAAKCSEIRAREPK